MLTIKEVIVVEGKTDVATLSNIIKAEFIITNGFEISDETIDLIKKVNETKGVILFLDPDGPGEHILEALENLVTLEEREISITYLDFYNLGLVGFPNTLEKRLKIEDYFRIGHGSAKTCLKRLNMLGVTLDELKEVLKTI